MSNGALSVVPVFFLQWSPAERHGFATTKKDWADAWREAGGTVFEQEVWSDIAADVAKAETDPAHFVWFTQQLVALFTGRILK